MKFTAKNDLPLMSEEEGVVLFYPHIPKNAAKYVGETLSTRWIGQGPKVERFEHELSEFLGTDERCLAVSSGTAALHLAYVLAGVKEGDEVLCPVFTCTATNLPILYQNAKPVFVDIDPQTLNICTKDLERKVTDKTKAISVVHYGGLPCDMDEILRIAEKHNLVVIEDAAHAFGAEYKGRKIGTISPLTMFSFQAIKTLTTGDGGALIVKDKDLALLGERLRWFGIDRRNKQLGIWENDISELGYKYQMTDISASIGLAGLEEIDEIVEKRQALYKAYVRELDGVTGLKIVDDFSKDKKHGAWLFTILVEDRVALQNKLRDNGIESGQTHYRNDRYSVFNDSSEYPNMDLVDEKYLILPLHTKMSESDVERVCSVIKSGW